MNRILTVGKHFSNNFKKAEVIMKIVMGAKPIIDYFASQINQIENIENYQDFILLQNRLYVVTGKSQSDRRRFFNNKMKSEKTKAFNEYNRLLRVLKKQNQFEQDQYNKLLF